MPSQSDLVYRSRETIVTEMIAALQARIPDAQTGPDSVWRIIIEVVANSIDGLYLAAFLLNQDLYVQTAEYESLLRRGEEFGLGMKLGTPATGTVAISGDGGTVIPLGTQVGAPQVSGSALLFNTTVLATIPNPGTPTAPVPADALVAGNLTGLYEWAVTFVTLAGETQIGALSSALTLTASQASLTAIPVGGPGTTARKLYRSLNGGLFQYTATLNNNTTTTYTDNAADGTLGGQPPPDSTAETVAVAIESDQNSADYNLAAGTITEIANDTDATGISSVVNNSPTTGGSDPESMEQYRQHLLDFVRNAKSGSSADLEMWAETIDGVESATSFPNDNLGTPTAGHVTVRIAGPAGAIPDADTIAAVAAELALHDLANITIHVGTFTPVTVNVTVTTTRVSGYTLGDVTPGVQKAVADYINSTPVGGTVYVAGITDAIFGLPGIATVVVNTPTVDTTTTGVQKPIAGTVTVS
jgi:uncharacterized phage protein gp47/JayE